MSNDVQRAVLSLHEQQAGPLKLWQIYQLVPALRAKLSALDKMPLTRRAIEAALSKRSPKGGTSNLFS
jgi:hypothetical protein